MRTPTPKFPIVTFSIRMFRFVPTSIAAQEFVDLPCCAPDEASGETGSCDRANRPSPAVGRRIRAPPQNEQTRSASLASIGHLMEVSRRHSLHLNLYLGTRLMPLWAMIDLPEPGVVDVAVHHSVGLGVHVVEDGPLQSTTNQRASRWAALFAAKSQCTPRNQEKPCHDRYEHAHNQNRGGGLFWDGHYADADSHSCQHSSAKSNGTGTCHSLSVRLGSDNEHCLAR